MEEKKVTKISLSTFFLILALIVIVVMAIFIYKFYNEKTEANEKSAELQTQVTSLNGTVSDLQRKIDNISETINSNTTKENTTPTNESTQNTIVNSSNNNSEIKYDVEITVSEVANVYKEWQDKGNDMSVFEKFNNKYIGKIIKVTGTVDSFGKSNDNYDTYINLVDTSLDRVYASGRTDNKEVIEQINKLSEGQTITMIGTYSNDPNIMTLNNIKIIEE